MAIYAILAVEFFRDFGKGYQVAEYTTMTGNYVEGSFEENITAITARGFTIGDEYYGTFSRSMYTLFQVMTGESWSEAIARPLVFGYSPPYGAVLVGVFFTSFILLMQIVLVNVVVAVLLDKFTEASAATRQEDAEEAKALLLKSARKLTYLFSCLKNLCVVFMFEKSLCCDLHAFYAKEFATSVGITPSDIDLIKIFRLLLKRHLICYCFVI